MPQFKLGRSTTVLAKFMAPMTGLAGLVALHDALHQLAALAVAIGFIGGTVWLVLLAKEKAGTVIVDSEGIRIDRGKQHDVIRWRDVRAAAFGRMQSDDYQSRFVRDTAAHESQNTNMFQAADRWSVMIWWQGPKGLVTTLLRAGEIYEYQQARIELKNRFQDLSIPTTP